MKMMLSSFGLVVIFFSIAFVGLGGVTKAYAPEDLSIIEVTSPSGKIVDGMTQEERAAKIDAYFAQWNLPLEGYGMVFVQEADKYEQIDWRLLAGIGMKESTGGKFAFAKNNYFGWGRKVEFQTVEHAIAEITRHLAGEHENTAYHYEDKDTKEILLKYNSVIPTYSSEIFAIMDDIKEMDTSEIVEKKLSKHNK
jgi:hypothetical protein